MLMPSTMQRVRWSKKALVSSSEKVLLSGRDGKCVDKYFPSDIHSAPELLVGNSECTGVAPEPVDSHCAREKYMRRSDGYEFGRELLQLSAHVLIRGVLGIKGGGCWQGK